MIGGIYSRQKCPICGSSYRDDGRKSLVCPNHQDQKATSFAVKFKGIYHRFKSYETASRFLNGLRFKVDEGSFDHRDYRNDNPLGFANLADRYLEIKKEIVKKRSFNNIKNYILKAVKVFQDRNIKEIGYAEIEDLILSQDLSDKSRANMKSVLHDFWTWLSKRKVIAKHQIPEFPEIKYELALRATISKDVQELIMDEIYRISYLIDPKIWLGIKWLATYISIRPGELTALKEGNIDLGNGYLIIPYPKEKKPKLVPLLDEDVEVLKTFPRGMPDLYFFRHPGGIKGSREGEAYGQRYFWKWWKRACNNIGIQGVDMYGGTRHSSAKALRQNFSPEEIKRATMHSTNKAFERYFQIENKELKNIYKETRREKGKILKLRKD